MKDDNSRRVFLRVLGSSALAVGAAACGGSDEDEAGGSNAQGGSGGAGGAATDASETLPPGVNVGPVVLFSEPGLHQIAGTNLLVGRDQEGLFARSSVCTHQGCNLNEDGASQPGGGIRCGCHGSQFDATGTVLGGPANRPLPALTLELGDDGNLYVDGDTLVDSSARLAV